MSEKQRKHEKGKRKIEAEVALTREKEITEAQAKEILQKNTADRLARCRQKIQKACLEENCELGADIIWRQGQLIPRPVITPLNLKDEGEKKGETK